jgi:ADP-dependent NAD(P)H-hydrate dehydratase
LKHKISKTKLYGRKQAKANLPKRRIRDSKTAGGKVLLVAGSKGMWGAAILCATAAARTGAGYVYLQTEGRGFPVVKHPDFLHVSGKDSIAWRSAIIGPGLQNRRKIQHQIQNWIRQKKESVVVDATALRALNASDQTLPPSWILTPHEGEMAGLLKKSSAWVKAHRKQAAVLAQKKFGCIIVLKGHRTLVAHASGLSEIQSGNQALAKAGTGDVLTGMIAALLAQQVPPLKAAQLAVFLHGLIADRWLAKGEDHLSLMASDLLADISHALVDLRRTRS